MKKYLNFLFIFFVFICFNADVFSMEEQEDLSIPNTPKFDSTKDYHHFYSNLGFVKSLQAICLGTIANDVKNNIDTRDPLSQESQVQEILDSIEDLGLSKDCLLQYWKVHTQPIFQCSLGDIPISEDKIKCYNSGLFMGYNESFDKIFISEDCVYSLRHNPCKNKIKFMPY